MKIEKIKGFTVITFDNFTEFEIVRVCVRLIVKGLAISPPPKDFNMNDRALTLNMIGSILHRMDQVE